MRFAYADPPYIGQAKKLYGCDEIERCYVCGTVAGNYHRQLDDSYSIIKCANCGLEYTAPIPKEEELKSFYMVYEDIRADHRIVKSNAQEHLKILSNYGLTSKSKILDFGAGTGAFVEMAGECCFGVDLNHSHHSRIKKSIEELKDHISWDCIALWGVIEHLPDPMVVMKELVSRLRKGGLIALTTVNAEGIIPYYYKPPEHLTYWTKNAFEVLADNHDLEILEYEPYKMFQIGQIYFDRLLSRTPDEYREMIWNKLPEVVCVPTNEVFVLMQKK